MTPFFTEYSDFQVLGFAQPTLVPGRPLVSPLVQLVVVSYVGICRLWSPSGYSVKAFGFGCMALVVWLCGRSRLFGFGRRLATRWSITLSFVQRNKKCRPYIQRQRSDSTRPILLPFIVSSEPLLLCFVYPLLRPSLTLFSYSNGYRP